MSMVFKNTMGNVNVSSKLISDIAAKVTESCYGVVGMAARNKTDGFVNLLRGENKAHGIKVSFNENKAIVELHIVVEFGLNITSTCKSIANRVRYTLETVTGIPVRSVNIRVEGIRVSE
ncbi:MAG: Asp23/Gls24 family envelope stress response protein [Clostridia bacterium]|nr:Asp23/Gls24 family envelope stress response protein [Clostridia bacterium]